MPFAKVSFCLSLAQSGQQAGSILPHGAKSRARLPKALSTVGLDHLWSKKAFKVDLNNAFHMLYAQTSSDNRVPLDQFHPT